MKYILTMNGKRSDFEGYAKWSKEDLRANVDFHAHIQQRTKGVGSIRLDRRPGVAE
jgi:hypothetical protein